MQKPFVPLECWLGNVVVDWQHAVRPAFSSPTSPPHSSQQVELPKVPVVFPQTHVGHRLAGSFAIASLREQRSAPPDKNPGTYQRFAPSLSAKSPTPPNRPRSTAPYRDTTSYELLAPAARDKLRSRAENLERAKSQEERGTNTRARADPLFSLTPA